MRRKIHSLTFVFMALLVMLMALRRKNIPKACPFALIYLYLQGKIVENLTFAVQNCESSVENNRNDEK